MRSSTRDGPEQFHSAFSAVDRPVRRCALLARACGAFTVLAGLVPLVGYLGPVPVLYRGVHESQQIMPITAILLVLCGIGVWALSAQQRRGPRLVARIAFAIVALVGAAIVAEHLLQVELLFVRVLFPTQANPVDAFPGRPAGTTGVCLLLLGVGGIGRTMRRAGSAGYLAPFATAVIGMMALAAFAYGAHRFSLFMARGAGMAPHTALAVLVASVGAICAPPAHGVMALVVSPRPAGALARRLLLASLAVPLAGVGVILAARFGPYDPAIAESLLACAGLVIAVVLVLVSAQAVDRADCALLDANQALDRKAESLAYLVQEASDGLFLANRDGRFLQVNASLARLLGYPAERLLEMNLHDLVPQGHSDLLMRARDAASRESTLLSDAVLQSCNGSQIDVEVSMRLRPDGKFQAIVRDVRGRKAVERMREEWASVVAHDLRQPVNVISLAAMQLDRQLTKAQALGAPEKKNLDRIQQSAKRLERMIADLLDTTRVAADRLVLKRDVRSVHEVVRQIVERLEHVVGGAPVRVEAEGDALCLVDAERLEQVIGNLLSNAVKYGEPGAEIVVGLQVDAAESVVSVTNHGRGIDPEEQSKLFSRFHRSRGSGELARGIGLGLYISRGIVEAHGGRMWVNSVPGQTTTFSFTLPRVETLAHRGHAPPAQPPAVH